MTSKISRRQALLAGASALSAACWATVKSTSAPELGSAPRAAAVGSNGSKQQARFPGELVTTLGRKRIGDVGMILPHEHVFLEFRTWNQPGYGEVNVDDVIKKMIPELKKARDSGITVMTECTAVGLGRRADILQKLSEATGLPLILPTGIYREQWIPPWARAASETELSDWMIGELKGKIEGSNTPAGWIKLAASDNGLTEGETKILRAAASAGRIADAAIGSHTTRGNVVLSQLDLLEAQKYPLERFIWFHSNRELNFDFHLEAAKRGVWIAYEGIGRTDFSRTLGGPDELYVKQVLRALEAGLADRLLLSIDCLGYDPASNGLWAQQPPYGYINNVFLPKLAAAGVGKEIIHRITHENAFRAYATTRFV